MRCRIAPVFVFVFLFSIVFPVRADSILPSQLPRPLQTASAAISLNVPDTAPLGADLTFQVSFDNTGDTPGYGPIVDLILDTTGADGVYPGSPAPDNVYDGLGTTTVNVSFATFPIPSSDVIILPFDSDGCVDHPFMLDSSSQPVQVCGTPGDTLVVVRLPFGSFTPDQPAATLDVTVNMSNWADVGMPLSVQARGGFQFGQDPLNNPAVDDPSTTLTSWSSDTVTPAVLTLNKSYSGPEDETATGPNYPRQYTFTATIAGGQTLTDFHLVDSLPANLAYLGNLSCSPGSYTVNSEPPLNIPANPPNNVLDVSWTSVSGTVSCTFEFFIPRTDADNNVVIDPDSGDDVISCNQASATGSWVPSDPRDTGQTFNLAPSGCEHSLTDKSIAIQKDVTIAVDNNASGVSPGDVLEYTLRLQVSDFFAFDSVVVTDVISDGQHFDPSFTPTLQVNGNGHALAESPFNINNYSIVCNYTGGPGSECTSDNPGTNDGTTTILLDISDEIITRGQDGRLVGGCINPSTGSNPPDCTVYNDEATTAIITFRTVIQPDFTDTYPSGDVSVDQGDVLDDGVTVQGNVLNTINFLPTGQNEIDISDAEVNIEYGSISKSIYAVNGSTSYPSPVRIAPGDTVTYRIRYTLPTSRFEDLVLTDYLPLPVFHVSEFTGFSNTICGIPAAGTACLGPADTYHSLPGANAPSITVSAANNSISGNWGDYDITPPVSSVIDIVFTFTVSTDPFADGLYLTNLATSQEGSTQGASSTANGAVQFQLQEPQVSIFKGVVWTDNPNGMFDPAAVGPVAFNGDAVTCAGRIGGTITSAGLSTQPVNSNLSNVDAVDKVMMAVVLENTGRSSAFDVRIKDVLPSGMSYIPGSLCVTDGTGAGFGFTDLGGGLFGTGIELDDPGPTPDPPGALDPGKAADGSVINTGRNIAVITYLARLDGSVQGGEILINRATLFHYAGAEGGGNHVPGGLEDDARVQVRYAGLSKVFTTEIVNSGNGNTQAVIGELVTYTVSIIVPEGQLLNVALGDYLPASLAFVHCVSVTPSSSDVTTDLPGGFAAACNDPTNPTVSFGGQSFTFTLGTITNVNRDNTVEERVDIQFNAVVLNISSNQAGTTLRNEAQLVIDGGAGGTATVYSSDLTIIEPTVSITKTAAKVIPTPPPPTVDGGDTVEFVITVSNPASVDAFDVTITDTFSALIEPTSLTVFSVTDSDGALTPSDFSIAGNALTTLNPFDLPANGARTVSVTVRGNVIGSLPITNPAQTIPNTAQVRWTSLDGDVQDRSSYNSASDERNGSDGPGGALNDYAANGSSTVLTAAMPAVQKSLVATSENHTPDTPSPARYTIGEIVRYRLAVTVPEGQMTNFQLQDQLPNGLMYLNDGTARVAFISNGAGISSSGIGIVPAIPAGCTVTGNSLAGLPSPLPCVLQNGNVGSTNSTSVDVDNYLSGTDPYFKLGSLVNQDNDSDAEYVVVEFNALVDNTTSGDNDRGEARNNNFRLYINNVLFSTSNSVNGRIVEPVITDLAKSAVPNAGDAGDTITYTVTFSNSVGGATTDVSTAFDVLFTDTLPSPQMDTVTMGSVAYVPAGCGVLASDNSAGNTISLSFSSVNSGCQVTITYTARLTLSVAPGEIVLNTARVEYTSLPGANGTSPNPTGSTTPGGSGADNGERNGSGTGKNTYFDTANAPVTVNAVAPGKSIVQTSEAHSGVVGGYPRLVPGEIVRYRFEMAWPESTSTTAQFRDFLPDGLVFLNDNTAKVAFVCNGPGQDGNPATDDCMVAPPPFGSAPVMIGNETTLSSITPSYTLPDEAISSNPAVNEDNYSSGTDVYFTGSIVNYDDDSDQEFIVLEFNALVLNESINQSGIQRDNAVQVTVNGVAGPISPAVSLFIAEPQLSISKSITIAPLDAGDQIVYSLLIQNTDTSANGATAFDLILSDTFDSYLNGLAVTSITTTQGAACNGGTVFSHNGGSFAGSTLTFTASCLDPGQSITIEVSGTVGVGTPAGYVIPNTAGLTYTSLPGAGTSPNPTGSVTPGGSGADNGERNGSGTGSNDYLASASAHVTLAGTPAISKQAPVSSGYPIGALVAYPIRITLPEGVTRAVRVTDSVPDGMQYASYSVDTSGFNGTVNTTPGVSGGAGNGEDVIFDFGSITTIDDNDPDNNTFILIVTLRVLDVPANELGVTLTNGASLTYKPGLGDTDTTLDGGTQNIIIQEPRIETSKSVSPASNVQAGDTITYTVRFTNTGTSTAYDVTAADTLAQGVNYNNDAACIFFDGTTRAPIGVTVSGTTTLSFDGNPSGSWDIPAATPNAYIECTYTVTAQSSLYLDGSHTNTVDADWTSLDGVDVNERVYDDSVSRTVDGAQDTAAATFTSPAPTFDKSDNAANLPIGAAYRVTLTLTSPLGTLRSLTVSDVLPAGLIYVAGSQTVSSGISPVPTFTVSSPNDGSVPVTLAWTFGDAVISSSPVTIQYDAIVANVVGNQNGTMLTNDAALSYTDAPGASKNLTDSDNIVVVEPVLTMDKTILVPPSPPDAGGVVTYKVVIEHDVSSAATAYDIDFVDTLPVELTLGSVSISLSGGASGASDNSAGNQVRVRVAEIPIGGSATITYSATINSGVIPDQSILNTGNLTWTSTAGSNSYERTGADGQGGTLNDYADSDQSSFQISGASYDKTLETSSASHTSGSNLAVGEVATFGLYVNLPEGTTPSLTIVDDLPAGMQYVSGSAQVVTTTGGVCGSNLTADFNGSVPLPIVTAPGGSGGDVTIQFGAVIVAGDNVADNNAFVVCLQAVLLNESSNQNGGTLSNSASFQIGSGTPVTDSTTIHIVEPELNVDKTVDDATPGVGQTFTYTLTVSRLPSSTADAFDLSISDTLPSSVSVSGAPTVSDVPLGCAGTITNSSAGNNIALTVASLPLGCVLTIQYQAIVNSPPAMPGDVISNTVNLLWSSLAGVDPNERTGTDGSGGLNDYADSSTQNVTFTAVDLRIEKDDGGITSTAGGVIKYTLTYTNLGNSDSSGVTVIETVPDNTVFNAGESTSGWSCPDGSPAGTVCTYTVGGLTAGGSGSIIFAVSVNNPLPSGVIQIDNTVSIEDDGTHGGDVNLTNNRDDDDTPVAAAPDLQITKDDGVTVVSPGQVVTYTLTIRNVGTQDATGVVVTDTIPADTTFISASDGGTYNNITGVVTWPTFDLAAGAAPVTRTVTVQINNPFPGSSILNQAHVEDDGSNGNDPNLADNDASDTDSVITLPNSDLIKALTATNQTFTPNPAVAIGEILTYDVTFTVPAGGTMPELTLTDILDRGLAFVNCVSITSSSAEITTTLAGGLTAACNDPVNPTIATEPAGSTNPADAGRLVRFDLGDVSNSGSTDGTVTIRYRTVVLDSFENRDGVSLNNAVTLKWSSGELSASAADVRIVEPDFELRKAVDRTVVTPGSIVTFTLTLRHTNRSDVNAYDVLLTDRLPSGLTYVPGSLTIVSGPAGGVTDDTALPLLRVRWDEFPLLTGGNRTEAVVQFRARVGNLSAGSSITNTAALEWSSLPGNVSAAQSSYNSLSTERFYDPGSNINIYGVQASAVLTIPGLPETGFAPGRVSALPEQPVEKTYHGAGELWLEIPRLNKKLPVVGVPLSGKDWDLRWLWDQAGWLEGTAFPSWAGNSVITAHVYLPNGKPGPFVNLNTLYWGDPIILRAYGKRYVYEVREVLVLYPDDLRALKHEEYPWLTLLTCQGYDAFSDTYRWRVAVRAVLVKVE